MSDQAMMNLQWCDALLCGLEAAGVSDVVISPGSRNTPLILAADRRAALRCHVQIDERCAAFYALGIARAQHRPVALICTSGSAPGNWHPAVIEADTGGTPLILLSADRPWELQNNGANQSIDQIKLFGGSVRGFHALPPAEATPQSTNQLMQLGVQAVHQSLWPDPGPVHINVPLREPLVPAEPLPEAALFSGQPAPSRMPELCATEQQLLAIAHQISGQPGVIVCGGGIDSTEFNRQVTALATICGAPIFADPLSGLRFGEHDLSHVVVDYDTRLRDAKLTADLQPHWILRFGAMPVSKQLQQFLQQSSAAQHILVDPTGRWQDPLHHTSEMMRAAPGSFCRLLRQQELAAVPAQWLYAFVVPDSRGIDSAEEAPLEQTIVQDLISGLPDGSILFSGNSLPIRYLDSYSGKRSKPLQVVANRGASGIDGNVSTLLGMAVESEKQDVTVAALIGDLTLYHDMNGLLAAKDLNAVIVVLNNHGGGIFKQLPQSQLPQFDRYWRTDTEIDLQKVADLYALEYFRVEQGADFSGVLQKALHHEGVVLIEVMMNA
ncbi:MAG: 2-succinyl-5-enolpyruvyl-6-hydroxy-3-cyclohexene-1-carboxylic-acid synthase [Gammaproteobacteria bacterium]|nr:2-succinyl-5-enolpyruvyl-6-hydroxy-3-cyclohexene-1-carboxylic-acid synthase [Gammaproteobacteria bacterium]